jgi:hypothetical protein
MTDNASRRGAADLGMPLMVVAFLVMGGFMYWLYGEAKAEAAIQIVEDDTTEVVDNVEGAVTVAAVDIQLDATPYEGQMIRIAGLSVASELGTQGFWLGMPNGNPFLVSMSDEVTALGLEITQGTGATVVGIVHPMTPEIAQAWLDAGTIADGDKLAAEFALHYMEAQVVAIVDGGEEGNDGGGDAGAAGN